MEWMALSLQELAETGSGSCMMSSVLLCPWWTRPPTWLLGTTVLCPQKKKMAEMASSPSVLSGLLFAWPGSSAQFSPTPASPAMSFPCILLTSAYGFLFKNQRRRDFELVSSHLSTPTVGSAGGCSVNICWRHEHLVVWSVCTWTHEFKDKRVCLPWEPWVEVGCRSAIQHTGEAGVPIHCKGTRGMTGDLRNKDSTLVSF